MSLKMEFSHMSLEVFMRLRRLGLGVRRRPVSPGDGSIKKIRGYEYRTGYSIGYRYGNVYNCVQWRQSTNV